MLLRSLSLRDYRRFAEKTVEFDPQRTLIAGPNGAGKSTIAEAIHRALFLSPSVSGDVRDFLIPRGGGGPPTVVLEFSAHGQDWTLKKIFAGANKSSIQLTGSKRGALTGESARLQLAELTGSDGLQRGGKNAIEHLSEVWSHLWIWQGSSGRDPAQDANANRDDLVQRLQQQNQGLEAVLLSALDQSVAKGVEADLAALFTDAQRDSAAPVDQANPRAGSPWHQAQNQHQAARAQRDAAESRLEQLRQASATVQRCSGELTALEERIPQTRAALEAARTQLEQGQEVQRRQETLLAQFDQARTQHRQLQERQQQLAVVQAELKTAQTALEPAQQAVGQAKERLEEVETRLAAAEGQQQQREQENTRNQWQLNWAQLALDTRQTEAEQAGLRQRLAAEEELEAQRQELRRQLAQLPAITAAALANLQKWERELGQLNARLEAQSPLLELLSADQPVFWNGEELALHATRRVEQAGELHIGGTRLRLRPGGGEDLAALAHRRDQLAANWRQQTQEWGVADVSQAQELLARRAQLETRLQTLAAAAPAGRGPSLRQQTQDLEDQLAQLSTRRSRIQQQAAELGLETDAADFPADVAAARSRRAAAQHAAEEFSAQHRQHEADVQAARAARAQARTHWERTQEAAQTAAARVRELQIHHQLLVDELGDEPTRQAALASTSAAAAQLEASANQAKEELARLQLPETQAEIVRLHGQLQSEEQRSQLHREQLAVARAQLAHDGSQDPEAELALAEARLDEANAEEIRQRRQALGLLTLHRELRAGQSHIQQSLSQPLRDGARPYLELLFGPGSELRLDVEAEHFQSPRLHRPGHPEMPFSQLSGGEKEQVAATLRLALAEILARSTPGGTLPMILDDAFAFADAQRTVALQRVLHRASQNGLQIILLSCTPLLYTGFVPGKAVDL